MPDRLGLDPADEETLRIALEADGWTPTPAASADETTLTAAAVTITLHMAAHPVLGAKARETRIAHLVRRRIEPLPPHDALGATVEMGNGGEPGPRIDFHYQGRGHAHRRGTPAHPTVRGGAGAGA